MPPTQVARKLLGAWYTPHELVDLVVERTLAGFVAPPGRPVRVLDPACGDGRFPLQVRRRLEAAGVAVEITCCDVDPEALGAIDGESVRTICADALAHDWSGEQFDIVVGNPPFLSQMAAATSRGGASTHGGGPYADVAAEFLALAVRLARPEGGRVGLVLPQSIVGSRDAGPVRTQVSALADLTWSWWAARQQHFDAAVNVCALGFERPGSGATTQAVWTGVVTERLGVPRLEPSRLARSGTLADRADLNANFRDEYYALVPAVSDGGDGPPLVTSGLIDPGRCLWGERPMTFAKRTYLTPRVDVSLLQGRFRRWAERKLVPKVLVANQTRIIEAVADPTGAWLPGVPVTTITPTRRTPSVEQVAAVLTSPVASAMAWQLAAGTGLSTSTVRVGPALLGGLPWPSGDLAPAVAALSRGDILECGRAVDSAFGLDATLAAELLAWWAAQLPVRD